jgi:hypothetical protein
MADVDETRAAAGGAPRMRGRPGARVDVLVVGGGLGGSAAALAACRAGRRVVLTEHTDWLGGQLTVQAVPPDEHPWIEQTGATAAYRAFRAAVRARYRACPALAPSARADPRLNPGQGWVSALCCEPAVAAAVLDDLLAPHVASGRLEVWREHAPVAAEVDGDRVVSVTLAHVHGGQRATVEAPFVLDATETGDLLPLTGCEHVLGAEARADTGEAHARADGADPLDQQAITWCFALEHRPGEQHVIDRPASYGFWRDYRAPFWPGPQLGWATQEPETGGPLRRPLFAGPGDDPQDLWTFHRIRYAGHYRPHHPDAPAGDVTLVNWPHIDYWLGPVVGPPAALVAEHRRQAKDLGRAFLYWLQTAAPRPDGGTGWPGLRLHPSAVGTADGFAREPYIRESRRVRALETVTEERVGVVPGRAAPPPVADSVGVGSYRIDLHPSTGGTGYVDIPSHPFQIPLGALLPVRLDNLLPAAKNLGTTHVTNGCFRLHPVEWNVGEVAGTLAAFCLETDARPRQVHAEPARREAFQRRLAAAGVVLSWPEELRSARR